VSSPYETEREAIGAARHILGCPPGTGAASPSPLLSSGRRVTIINRGVAAMRVSFFVLAFVVSLVLTKHWLPSLVITGGLFAVLYWFSLHRRPFQSCRTCNGTGRHRGTIFLYAHRQCPACGGSGRHRRWGNVRFRPITPTVAERQAKAAAKRPNRPL
jgi:hypothetical protein